VADAPFSPLERRLIQLLAQTAVDRYLTAQPANDAASGPERPYHVPLPDQPKAA
jgi:hypothetical protein